MIPKLLQQRAAVFYGAAPLAATPDWDSIESFDDPVFQEKRRHEHFRRRLDVGHRCFGYRDGGQVVCYLWLTTGRAVPLFLGGQMAVPADETHVWDCRTIASHQGRGYYTRGLFAARAQHPEARQVTIIAERSNAASQTAIQRAGFAPRYAFTVTRVVGLRLLSIGGGWPVALATPWHPPAT